MTFEDSLEWARAQDSADELAALRAEFLFPDSGPLYFAGHSLGLQPRRAREYVLQELDDWRRLGVEGHFSARNPWVSYHELLTGATARLVGALPHEVVVMNTLSVNLHLLMVSFYRPRRGKHRLLIEHGAFPSDRYAVASQARFHGFPDAVLESEDPLETLRERDDIALALIGNVNYLTGRAYDMRALVRAAQEKEAFDRAGMPALRRKGDRLTAYLELLLRQRGAEILTPAKRGSMLTVRFRQPGIVAELKNRGAVVDSRPPDIVRITPAPLYNSFEDVQRLCALIGESGDA